MRKITLISFWLIAIILIISCNSIVDASINSEPAIAGIMAKLNTSSRISQNEASKIADMFMRSYAGRAMPLTKSAESNTKRVSSSATIREDGQDLMYVFNYEDGGFVIVGSTRNYYPILAYSDKGSFDLQDDMGPVDVWLDETKVSIKNSDSLDEATKAQMQTLWSRYDGTFVDPAQELLAARRPQTRSVGEDSCWAEIERLQAQYGDEGWTFLPLSFVEDLFDDLGLSNDYATICNNASQNYSALNETVIGYRYPAVNQVGPLLSTEWHQGSPFNSLCPNQYPAGSADVALGQIMKYQELPDTLVWNGTTIQWSDIPVSPNTTPNKIPQLMARLGQLFNESYSSSGTSTMLAYVLSGVMQVNCILSSLNSEAAYRAKVYNDHIPVLMYGTKTSYILSENHMWVCDGVRQAVYNQLQFYTENQPNGEGHFYQGMYTYDNPGLLGQQVGTPIYTYHMNWGLQGGAYNGWFSSNYSYSSPINYNENRSNYYLSENPLLP